MKMKVKFDKAAATGWFFCQQRRKDRLWCCRTYLLYVRLERVYV